MNETDRLLLLKEALNKHSDWLGLLQEEETKNYTDCIHLFLSSNDRIIQEGSIATCQLIINKVKKNKY